MEIVRKVAVQDVPVEFIANLPEIVKTVLGVLKGDVSVGIKGGIARLMLIEMLRREGVFKDESRYQVERKINDVDLCLLREGSWEKTSEELVKKGIDLQEKLAKAGIELEPRDTEFFKGFSYDPATIRKFLCSRDLTFNEVLVTATQNGQWQIHYTPQCKEDLIEGVGFLNPKPGLIWYVGGRVIPSPFGFARLFKYLVAGKAKKIILPEFWLNLYFEEIARRVEGKILPAGAPKLPEGGTMGLYSMVLMELYCQGDLNKQRRVMKILKDLKFTDLIDPAIYLREQKILFQMYGRPYELNKLTWEQVVQRQKASAEMINNGKKERKDAREKCAHEMEINSCQGCGYKCAIGKCQKCTHVVFDPPLPCNEALYRGELSPKRMRNTIYVPPFK